MATFMVDTPSWCQSRTLAVALEQAADEVKQQREEALKHGYITIMHGIRGFFAEMVLPDPDCGGECMPYTSGYMSGRTAQDVRGEALDWAQDEELPFYYAGELVLPELHTEAE